MLSGILSSERAVAVNIAIVRAFVHLRRVLARDTDSAARFEALSHQVEQNTSDIHMVADIIQQILDPPLGPPRRIGYPEP